MVHEVRIPQAGESIQEVQIGQWLKREGEFVEQDETIVELETDKASMDLPAPATGVVTKILKADGEDAEIGETIALIEETEPDPSQEKKTPDKLEDPPIISAAAQRLLKEHDVQGLDVQPSGPGGRVLKEDVLRHVDERKQLGASNHIPEEREQTSLHDADHPTEPTTRLQSDEERASAERPTVDSDSDEQVVPMSLIRRRIADRLVKAQQQAALLTTFNELDMSAVIDLRRKHQDEFQSKHGVKLGFMSFFVKATVEGLREFPAINAEIRENSIVYRDHYDIGVAIGGGKGLIVPALRNAEQLSFAEIEQKIADFASRAKANKIRPGELEGGTFTITNGGVYGSLLSTPIVNPPQSGVLGLHAIQKRPIAEDDKVVIRPMMYIALTYDHRLVDGREAVTFLKRIRSYLEHPARMLLAI